jgi:hypothetical protein
MEVRKIFGEENLKEYVKDIWKVMDLGTTCLYMIVVILQLLAFFEVSSCMLDAYHRKTLLFFTVSKREYHTVSVYSTKKIKRLFFKLTI